MCACRGMLPQQLIQHKLWWEGPLWLLQDPSSWPPIPILAPACDELEEIKATCSITTPVNSWLANKFSSFTKLKRVLTWTLQFVHNLKASKSHIELKLTATIQLQELQDAEKFLLKESQAQWFSAEFTWLNSSVLLPLLPFLDKNNLLRVGGRLTQTSEIFKVSSSHPPWQGSTCSLSGQSSPSHIMSCWTHTVDVTT